MIDRCEQEIIDLHRFFERWLAGEQEASPEALARLADVLSERFLLISPEGERRERRAVIEEVRRGHGSRQRAGRRFRIRIEGIEGRLREGGLCLMSYEEWHELDGAAHGRLSSALFRERPDAPNGVEWLHLHETWLPETTGIKPLP